MADAVTAAINAPAPPANEAVGIAADAVADAAITKADEIKGDTL